MGPGGWIEGQWHCCSSGRGGGGCPRVLTEARYWATLAQTNSWRVSPGKSPLLHRGNTIDRGSRFAWGGAESAGLRAGGVVTVVSASCRCVVACAVVCHLPLVFAV